MTIAIRCEICGTYVRKEQYRKHLKNAHGAGTAPIAAAKLPLPQREAAKPGRRANVPAAANGGVARAPAPLNRPHRVHPSIPLPGQRVSHRVTASLEPSSKQRGALDEIFLAPEFCLHLLLTHKPKIRTRSDAQMFLLQYKGEIDGYLPARNRSELVDLLSDFMLEWSKRVPSLIRLEFDCHIVGKASNSYARIADFGDMLLDNRSIRGDLPPPSLGVRAMVAKQQETYSVFFVYESTSSDPIPTVACVWNWNRDDEPHVAMPALKPRADGKKKQRNADHGSADPHQPKLVLSSPRIARPSKARPVQLIPCPLCGEGVERGGMLLHKQDFHNETMYARAPLQATRRHAWVVIYQGGAPGLGKGKS